MLILPVPHTLKSQKKVDRGLVSLRTERNPVLPLVPAGGPGLGVVGEGVRRFREGGGGIQG